MRGHRSIGFTGQFPTVNAGIPRLREAASAGAMIFSESLVNRGRIRHNRLLPARQRPHAQSTPRGS